MANNKKHEDGYAKLEGKTYHEIKDILAKDGINMRHTSVRNYFFRGLKKIALPLAELAGKDADELASDIEFQMILSSILKGDKKHGISI